MSRLWPDRRLAATARERSRAGVPMVEPRLEGVRRARGGRAGRSSAAWSWVARERAFALWMHGAVGYAWVLRLFEIVSRVGDGWIWYATVVVLPWVDHASGAACAVRMVSVGLIDLALYKIIKRSIARTRPCRAGAGFRECVRPLDEYSFPSGHTMHAVAFSTVLTAYHPHLAPFVWPFTALLATSRVVLGLHYPSDVIVGAALGATTALISFNVM